MTSAAVPRARGGSMPSALPSDSLTHVELTHIEKRIENWIRFGREVHEQVLDRRRRVFSYRAGSIFAFVRTELLIRDDGLAAWRWDPKASPHVTDINNAYLQRGDLHVKHLGRGFAWLDTGTHESLLDAGTYVQTIEHRQGQKVACLEEIAFNNGWLDRAELVTRGERLAKTDYGQYLLALAHEGGGR